MKEYTNLLRHIAEHGTHTTNRTGVGTKMIFGAQMRFDLREGFPIMTTKKVNFASVAHELLWFISGSTNIKYLNDNGVHIWDEWADKDGELGPVYGYQWRSWGNADGTYTDQLTDLIYNIKANPESRRHILTAWNPGSVDNMALPPCHVLSQFSVVNETLSCQLYQRSADMFLGVPFNIASYALLTHMIAQVTGLQVGEFIHTLGDAHIYDNHMEQVELQLSRYPMKLPELILAPEIGSIDDFTFEAIKLSDYQHHDYIPAPIAV